MTIQEALKKRDEAKALVAKWQRVIEALQSVCEHDLESNGYVHNHDEYFCRKCGFETRD